MPYVGNGEAAKNADVVYSPEHSDSCGSDCNNPFGKVDPNTLEQFAEPVIQAQITISNLPFAVDAALIDLDPKAEASNNIEDIGAISGTRDLIQEWGLTSPLPTNAATPDVLQLKPE